jgi:hypothetical protein
VIDIVFSFWVLKNCLAQTTFVRKICNVQWPLIRVK